VNRLQKWPALLSEKHQHFQALLEIRIALSPLIRKSIDTFIFCIHDDLRSTLNSGHFLFVN
jgi:hypothetical protein